MTQETAIEREQIAKAKSLVDAMRTELQKVIIGQTAVIDEVLTALLAEGHILIEGVPGLGKTILVRTLAECFNGEFARIQFTPDLMPTDITGHALFNFKTESFSYQKGPVFTNLLLADEINRAPAKTQAALLEVMQERQVTIEGKPESVPEPFMVLATQNPLEHEGTYPLPEAQLDRFLFKVLIDYPTKADELGVVEKVIGAAYGDILVPAKLSKLMQPRTILMLQKITRMIFVDREVVEYAVNIVRKTRESHLFSIGAGPRASIALIQGARAKALLAGTHFATPDQVKSCVLPALRHRVQLSAEMEIEGVSVDEALMQMLEQIPAPRV